MRGEGNVLKLGDQGETCLVLTLLQKHSAFKSQGTASQTVERQNERNLKVVLMT